MRGKPKYRIYLTTYGTPMIHRREFTIFPAKYYPQQGGHNYEYQGGWFEWRLADYVLNDGRWIFYGYSG